MDFDPKTMATTNTVKTVIRGNGLLSDTGIMRHFLHTGNIVIDPFDKRSLSTSSYDVRLGSHYFRESEPTSSINFYNPYDEEEVRKVWGEALTADTYSSYRRPNPDADIYKGISDEDRIIWVGPGESILAHTEEFIGGRRTVTTMMKARSSLGRNFIEVCKCSGWGDVGYINRFTMEITNNSRFYSIPLVVGRRVAQIVFFETEGIEGISYERCSGSKYQCDTDLEKVKRHWKPEDMLPKMYLDRECVATKSAAQ